MTTSKVCPSCGANDLSEFYSAKSVPINSSMLMSTKEEAIKFPRGDVELAFCQSCGFISNLAFDPSKLDYSVLCPEEQGFSGTFNAYAQKLAKHLIEEYDLHGKNILEIGCGRGDFLALLCELGNNSGVGIDPSLVGGHVQSRVADRLRFVHDYFSIQNSKYVGDFVCCRHTLEHIYNVAEFLTSVRLAIGDRLNTAVFFEVPDVTRILREAAFWDIYYEHCSYFSLGSLARLFRLCKFDIKFLGRDYFDQYLLIEAKPATRTSEKVFKIEESIEEMSDNVQSFSTNCQTKLFRWKTLLHQIEITKKKAVVWGSGSKCVAFMTTLNVKDQIEYVVDINPNRHGNFIPGAGKQIVAPEFLRKYKPEVVFVMNPVYCNEIGKKLESMGVAAELVPCC
jgi:SAM-dependent methyltransferase